MNVERTMVRHMVEKEVVARPCDQLMISMIILFLKTLLFTPHQAEHLMLIIRSQTRQPMEKE